MTLTLDEGAAITAGVRQACVSAQLLIAGMAEDAAEKMATGELPGMSGAEALMWLASVIRGFHPANDQ